MAKQMSTPRFLRIAEVTDRIGVSRATIYRWTAAGEFPKQIQLGANSVVWLESAVVEWMQKQIKGA